MREFRRFCRMWWRFIIRLRRHCSRKRAAFRDIIAGFFFVLPPHPTLADWDKVGVQSGERRLRHPMPYAGCHTKLIATRVNGCEIIGNRICSAEYDYVCWNARRRRTLCHTKVFASTFNSTIGNSEVVRFFPTNSETFPKHTSLDIPSWIRCSITLQFIYSCLCVWVGCVNLFHNFLVFDCHGSVCVCVSQPEPLPREILSEQSDAHPQTTLSLFVCASGAHFLLARTFTNSILRAQVYGLFHILLFAVTHSHSSNTNIPTLGLLIWYTKALCILTGVDFYMAFFERPLWIVECALAVNVQDTMGTIWNANNGAAISVDNNYDCSYWMEWMDNAMGMTTLAAQRLGMRSTSQCSISRL